MRRSPWTISVVSVRFAARPAASRCAKEPPPAELAKYVGVYIDVNMYYHTRGTAHVPAFLCLARPFRAAAARACGNADPRGADVPPFGIPAVFPPQGGNGMRPAVL